MAPAYLTHRSTQSHGYYSVTASRFAQMKREHPELLTPSRFYNGTNSFEEDAEVNRIILAFPTDFSQSTVATATRWCKDYHPFVWSLYSGAPINTADSATLRRAAFERMTASFYVAISAVNAGSHFVLVSFALGGRSFDTFQLYHPDTIIELLIPTAEYENRPTELGLSFYIEDPSLYESATDYYNELNSRHA